MIPAPVHGDRGAAPVEFVLVSALLTALLLGLLQVAITFHVRNVLTACAAEGARHAANADVADPVAGAGRANELITEAVGARYARAYVPQSGPAEEAGLTSVAVQAELPLLAWWLPKPWLQVRVEGHALREPVPAPVLR